MIISCLIAKQETANEGTSESGEAKTEKNTEWGNTKNRRALTEERKINGKCKQTYRTNTGLTLGRGGWSSGQRARLLLPTIRGYSFSTQIVFEKNKKEQTDTPD